MAKLKITRANGEVSEHKITPGVEYAFELKYGSGISKVLREHERQTEIFWLAYECLRRAGAQIPLWGVEFIDSLFLSGDNLKKYQIQSTAKKLFKEIDRSKVSRFLNCSVEEIDQK